MIGANKSELKKLAAAARRCARLAAGARRRRGQAVRRPRRRARRSCWSARPTGSNKEQAMHDRFCRAHRGGAGQASKAASRAPRSRSIAAATERQIGRLLGRNPRAAARYAIRLVDEPRLPGRLRLDWSSTARLGRLGAPQRRLLRAAHQHRRLEPRGAVADLHPAHPGRGRLPHPQERAVDPADLASARTIACWPTSWSASSPTCCGRCSSSGRAAPGSATARAPSSKNSPPSTAPTSSCPPQKRHRATCACAASYAPTAPRPPCSIASACAFPKGCESNTA